MVLQDFQLPPRGTHVAGKTLPGDDSLALFNILDGDIIDPQSHGGLG